VLKVSDNTLYSICLDILIQSRGFSDTCDAAVFGGLGDSTSGSSLNSFEEYLCRFIIIISEHPNLEIDTVFNTDFVLL